MKKILYILLITSLLLVSYTVFIKESNLIEEKDNVYLIRVFNLNSEDSLNIEDENDVKEVLTYLNKTKVRTKGIYLGQKNLEFLVSIYDQEGEVVETFYISKNKVTKHHLLLKITNHKDIYEFISNKYNKIN